MGYTSPTSSVSVSVIANDDTWIESSAVAQLEKTAQLTGITHAAGMPDLHPGRGYPIGAVFRSEGVIYPALVGSDIGCGMSLWQTNLKSHRLNLDKLEKRLTGLDEPLDESWSDLITEEQSARGLACTGFDAALGTIGGGNHFAEFQQVDEVYCSDTATRLSLDPTALVLMVHSGSRGLGEKVLRDHVTAYSHDGLAEGSEAFAVYMHRHDEALRFAELNRLLIAKRMLDVLRADGSALLDVNHNLVTPFMGGWLHRKGATPADCGPVVIPGSRGDFSYLVEPILAASGADFPNARSLCSLAHGAGRKWQRSECKGRLDKRYRVKDLERTRFGSRVICNDKGLIYEEAPEAYKQIDSVIASLLDAGLVRLIARFKPVITYKTRGRCC